MLVVFDSYNALTLLYCTSSLSQSSSIVCETKPSIDELQFGFKCHEVYDCVLMLYLRAFESIAHHFTIYD